MSKIDQLQSYLSRDHIRKFLRFLGPAVIRYLMWGILTGLALFIVELSFAYALQGFLIGLGILSQSAVSLPKWVPHGSLRQILLFIFFSGAARAFLQWAQVFLTGASVEEFKYLQRSRLLNWAFHSQSVSSSEITTLFNERTGVTSGTLACLQGMAVKLTSAIFVGLTLLWFSPTLTFMSSLALILMITPIKLAERRIRVAGDAVASTWSNINHRLYINIRNLLLMQIYGTQKYENELAQTSLNTYRRHMMEYTWIAGLVSSAPQFLGILLICLITAVAKHTNQLAPTSLISYFYLLFRFLQTFSTLSLDATSILHSWPQAAALAKWWADHSQDGVRAAQKPVSTQIPKLSNPGPIGWKISNISFGYSADSRLLIQNLELDISPGRTLVITGPSGSGKTTLLNLILGGLNPEKGSISIYSSALPETPLEEIRSALLQDVGYVGPESFLIEGSIRKNLLYGVLGAITESEITSALEQSESQFVFDLPLGLDHHLSEQGHGLSAGQKQRLSLARALLRRPKVLILDEPTANLDAGTELRLTQTLAQLKGKITMIIVSHREKLLELADQKYDFS